jgi:surface antigen
MTGTEHVICGSQELSQLDAEATKLVEILRARLPASDRDNLKTRVDPWLFQRALRCPPTLPEETAVSCLKTFYREYLGALSRPAPAGANQTGQAPRPAPSQSTLRTSIQANIDFAKTGTPITWSDANDAAHGMITFGAGQLNSQGAVCRSYSYTVQGLGVGQGMPYYGAACRDASGAWQHITGPFAESGQRPPNR